MLASLAMTVCLAMAPPRPTAEPEAERPELPSASIAVAGAFGTVAFILASVRLGRVSCEGDNECEDSRTESTLILGTPQAAANLIAFTASAVAGARIGQRWGDTAAMRRKHIIAGATTLVLGTGAAVTAWTLVGYDPRDARKLEHVWRTSIVLGEVGGVAAMLGIGYLARGVSRPRSERRRGLVTFAPRHDGITIGYAGRF